jgi:hypothetical protein
VKTMSCFSLCVFSGYDSPNIGSSGWFEFHFLAVMSSCFEFNFVQQNFV